MLGLTCLIAPSPISAKDKPAEAAKSAETTNDGAEATSSKAKPIREKTTSDKSKAKPDAKSKGDADASKPEQLGSYGDWIAYVAHSGKEKTCYALGQPKERQPKTKLKDTPGYIFISTRPAENVKNEVAINLGYPTKDGSSGAAEIDGESFELVTKGVNAWIKDQAKEKDFVGTLRGGAKLLIKASSAKATATTDIYSLKGLSDALARVGQECI